MLACGRWTMLGTRSAVVIAESISPHAVLLQQPGTTSWLLQSMANKIQPEKLSNLAFNQSMAGRVANGSDEEASETDWCRLFPLILHQSSSWVHTKQVCDLTLGLGLVVVHACPLILSGDHCKCNLDAKEKGALLARSAYRILLCKINTDAGECRVAGTFSGSRNRAATPPELGSATAGCGCAWMRCSATPCGAPPAGFRALLATSCSGINLITGQIRLASLHTGLIRLSFVSSHDCCCIQVHSQSCLPLLKLSHRSAVHHLNHYSCFSYSV